MLKHLLTIMLVLLSGAASAQKKASVFITAGQSNADGRAYVSQLPAYLQTDPEYLHFANITSTSHTSFYARDIKSGTRWAFQDVVDYYINQSLQTDFYAIKCTYGGTAIQQGVTAEKLPYWYAEPAYIDTARAYRNGTVGNGTSLTKSLTEGVASLVDGTLSKLEQGYDIKCIMWHQGESDRSSTAAANYYHNFKTMIAYMRNAIYEKTGDEADKTLPFIFGTVSPKSKQYSSAVEAAQRKVAAEDPNVYCIDLSKGQLGSDNLHFDAEGTQYVGRKFFNQLVKLGLVEGDTIEVAEPKEESPYDTVTVAADRSWDFTQAWSDASVEALKADSKWEAKSGWGYRYTNTISSAELSTTSGYVFPETKGLYFTTNTGNRACVNPGNNIGLYAGPITITVPKVKPGQYVMIESRTANTGKNRGLKPTASSALQLDSIAGGYASLDKVKGVWWVQDTFTDPVDATFEVIGGGIYIYKIVVSDYDPTSTSGIGNVKSRRGENGKIYTLGGAEVKTPKSRHVYIQDGKKIMR